MDLVLIRHARPAVASGLCYGQLDLALAMPISPDPACMAAPLVALPPERIVTSPAVRARDTAAGLMRQLGGESCGQLHGQLHGQLPGPAAGQFPAVPCQIESRLRELDFGCWEGQPWDAIARADLDDWAANLMTARPHGGESAAQVMARVVDWAGELDAAAPTCWWVVTHAGPMRMLAAHFLGLPLAQTLQWELGFGASCHLRIGEGGVAATRLGWWNRTVA